MIDLSLLEELAANMTEELRRAAKNQNSSLSYISHPLLPQKEYMEDTPFQILVIGGSICRKAIGVRKGQNVYISGKTELPLPQFQTKADFLNFIEEHDNTNVSRIALNFAYPLTPCIRDGRLDGYLMHGSKEHSFSGLEGDLVGKTIEQYFQQRQHRHLQVSVANDVICLLFSGKTMYTDASLACGIVGTGVNFAFFDSTGHGVNLESANFSRFPVSYATKILDAKSSEPGKALFEKEVAGAYLYQQFNILCQKDATSPKVQSTKELKDIALSSTSPFAKIAYELIEKSAAYVAAHIAGITKFRNRDSIFIMEGGFFWGDEIYMQLVELYLTHLTMYKITITRIPDSPYLGPSFLL